ncbi:hypothetical protein T459_29769 [Capsicum annuum]|uniref:Leucine-rich repeat-containing N-terminal plant-type domain-containing protein n=1 Tax=Capsicum annuum TaxID=4072 RepID=A0A2G2Y6I0_CAPAN|nr:hypothetical protein T459_29769 [Capsicum annuum]
MGSSKLVFSMLYSFLCQLAFSSSSSHFCPKDQSLALLQFKHMFTINPNASDYCYNSRTLSWNKSTDCCTWNEVHCEETTRQVIELDLYCNRLQGKFHSNSSLFHLSNLKLLVLSFNNFSCTHVRIGHLCLYPVHAGPSHGSLISPKFGELSSLTHLDLSVSGFTGPIPAEISHLSKLYILRIWTPDPYGLRLKPYNFELLLKNLTQLRELEFNSLRGVLAERVFHLSNLEYLHLPYNSLTGPIPSNVSGLQNLQSLYLSSNYLNGTIPSWIFSLPSLMHLDLSNNSSSGKIQEFKFNNTLVLQDLQVLILSQNNFIGQIASTVCNLKTLFLLDLGSNHLNGTIPQCLGEMSGLQIIKLHGNKLQGKVPPSLINCKYLELKNFQAMKIIGENSGTREYIAVDYSGYYANSLIVTTKGWDREFFYVLKTKIIINFSRNRFEGYLPSITGDLVGLRTLNLSHNGLEGIIAASLQHLSVLESLDLSSNKIGGEIPQQLVSLTSLAVLNFLTIILLDAFLKKSNLICLRTVHTKGMMVYVDCHSQKIVVAIMGYRKRQL